MTRLPHRPLLRWVLPVALIAAATHLAVIFAVPRVVMRRVMNGVAAHAAPNTPYHAPPATAATRAIPLPSPDLLYSVCALDVSDGPVSVSVTPGAEYLSLAVFDANTDNIFVTNDQQAGGQPISLLILGPASPDPAPRAGRQIVRLGTPSGLLLLRALAATPAQRAVAEAARQTLRCGKARA